MIKKLEGLLSIILVVLCICLGRNLWEDSQEAAQKRVAVYREITLTENPVQLPVYYNARLEGKAASIKDQGSLGTCWAVAASSAMESFLLLEQQVIFSPDHLAMQNFFAKEPNDGGDYTMVMAYLAGWQGPVLEADDPYGDGMTTEGLEPVKHVQEMQMLKNKDYEAMKQAIYRYGAVQSSIYMDLRNADSESAYYNREESAYYYNGEEKANHDVLVVGWDDEYFSENFSIDSGSPGAFICQNSWGNQFGEDGIFYVSYQDVNIGNNGIAYTKIEDSDNYSHLYETDLCGWVGQLGYGDGDAYFSNIYQSQGQENLEAVGFYALGKDTEYSVYVLENFDEMPTFLAGEPIAQGRIDNIGYYTIPLERPVELDSGERYGVVIKIHTPEAEYPVATEYAADEATKTVDISDGEGYISHNGVIWTRTETEHEANVCLKAYTRDRV